MCSCQTKFGGSAQHQNSTKLFSEYSSTVQPLSVHNAVFVPHVVLDRWYTSHKRPCREPIFLSPRSTHSVLISRIGRQGVAMKRQLAYAGRHASLHQVTWPLTVQHQRQLMKAEHLVLSLHRQCGRWCYGVVRSCSSRTSRIRRCWSVSCESRLLSLLAHSQSILLILIVPKQHQSGCFRSDVFGWRKRCLAECGIYLRKLRQTIRVR